MQDFLQTISSLNDETRIKILKYLQTNGECCVCELQEAFCMIQSRLSRHLKILKDGGFLKVRKDGKWSYYSLRSPLDEFRTATLKEISYLECEILPHSIKKVLFVCTHNSCRSIMAEALINAQFSGIIKAYSAGSNPSNEINPNAKKLLIQKGIFTNKLYPKPLNSLCESFDLAITLCDDAKKSCPVVKNAAKTLHLAFDDPSDKEFSEFEKTLNLMQEKLVKVVKDELNVV
ncbi:metalloregulator ArsR/SmtB family transcription factor [Campylobacter geochelonis]|uniref:ArsR family transcriptional regulator n=1 Tax=Campylobacter geochelonis TaxID=1780362 RepID=A0A128ER28_9BACT|nr:metalloregulator ArsR/SmtB family transcription factor [Campylobacter geochelonis]QKF71258.1 arsenate reductase, LMWPc family / transcriptional regulator, ArsR family [Campylobacter geochelonis]CZE48161.1 ArsR family transcriptional regulator [Campylobacter geochelonis]CZE49046.1 ArsR family transcriptional regulator [Campylobacter geochelonis]CZE51123.1 ArsR family transcriptional regulator [Campylobacter geochelonis]